MVFETISTFLYSNGYSATILFGFILLLLVGILHLFRNKIISTLTKKTRIKSQSLYKLELPIILLGIIIALEIILTKLLQAYTDISTGISMITETIVIIFITYALSIISGIVLTKWNRNIGRTRKDLSHEEILPLAKSVTNILLVTAAIFMILQTWGIQIAGLLASVGIAGIVLSFAFKDTLANIFGGISLIMDNSFKKGDLIEIENGEIGYIEEINLRSTKIKNFDSLEVIVPNGTLANMQIKNYAHPTKATRVKVNISIAYGSDVDKFEKVVHELIKKKEYILKYPKPVMFFLEMGEYSLKYMIGYHVKNFDDIYEEKSKFTKQLYKELAKNNIKVPFPTRTIFYGDSQNKK